MAYADQTWIDSNWGKKQNYEETLDSGLPTDIPAVNYLIRYSKTDKKGYIWKGDGTGLDGIWSEGGGGSSTLTIQNVASATNTITGFNKLITADASLNDVVITLPVANTLSIGQSIVVKKTDNSNKIVRIIPNGTDTIDSNLNINGIYLYGQNDCVTITSTAVGKLYISSDNRNSTGSSISYMRGIRTTTQTSNLTANAPVIFTSVDNSLGSKISLNTSTGIITLKTGSTYNLTGSAGEVRFSASGYARFQWYNITTSTAIGTGFGGDSTPTTTIPTEIATTTITPTVDTQIALYLVSGSNISAYGYGVNLPWFHIEEISRQATVINTMDYLNVARITSDVTGMGVNSDIIFNSIVSGNIPYNKTTGVATLTAGKTYELIGEPSFSVFSDSASGYFTIDWVDASTNIALTSNNQSVALYIPLNRNTNEFDNCEIHLIYTPTTNQNVKLRIIAGNGTATLRSNNGSKAFIKQIGSTACTDSITLNTINTNSSSGLNVHTKNTTTPTKLSVTNEFVGQNNSGSDYQVGTLNLGCDGFNTSVSTKIPNGAWGDGCRMDLCTPIGSNDNTQIPRVSVLPFTGNVGVGITTPTAKFEVKGTTNDGSTNIIVGKDSDGVNVFSVDSNGNVVANNIPNVVELSSIVNQLENITNISAITNTYTFDLQNQPIKNFKMETTDTNAKTIVFTNVPSNVLVQITVKLKYTNACSITRPASVVWQNGIVPTFTIGKVYFTQYITDDGGVTWYASSVGAW